MATKAKKIRKPKTGKSAAILRTVRPRQPATVTTERPEHVPGKIFVRFRRGVVESMGRPMLEAARGIRSLAAAVKAVPETVEGPLEYLRNNCGLKRTTPMFLAPAAPALPQAKGIKAHLTSVASTVGSKRETLRGLTMLEVDRRAVTPAMLRRLESSAAIEFAEPVPNRWISAPAKVDPDQNLQWGLRAIRWFGAQRSTAAAIEVAVLDTGIDIKHPEFKGTIRQYDDRGETKDFIGHGTHVAGVIAALTNNGVGISGIANCRLRIFKVFRGPEGNFDDEAFTGALSTLLDSRVQVINLSLGGTASSETERLAFQALHEDGKVIVAAMGNEFQEGNPTTYPAAYPHVVAVGAVNEAGRRAPFSNTGKHISVVAPGVSILSTLPTYPAAPDRTEVDFAAWDGTSMATPHVAGSVALIRAKHPGLNPDQVVKRLTTTCRKLPAMKGRKFTVEYGHGLVDLTKAL